MYSSDFLHLEHIAGEEGDDEQHNRDKERPCCEQFLLGRIALWRSSSVIVQVYRIVHVLRGETHPRGRSLLHRWLALCSIRQPLCRGSQVRPGYSILRSSKPIPTSFAEAIAKEPSVYELTKVVEVLGIISRSLRLGRDQVGDSLREPRKMRY